MTKTNIKKIKQDIIWNHVFFALDDLYNNYCYQDKEFNDMLYDLLGYVESKISPPDGSGDIVEKYVVVEYEEEFISQQNEEK